MKTPLPERIHQIVDGHNGIRASRLCAILTTEYLNLTSKEVKKTIMQMVDSHELFEIEYSLPSYQNESLLLPSGSQLRGTSETLWNK